MAQFYLVLFPYRQTNRTMKPTLILILWFLSSTISCQSQKIFNKEEWQKDKNSLLTTNDNQRLKMVQDILDNQLIREMTKRDVIDLLGKPNIDTLMVYLPKNLKFPDSLRRDYSKMITDEQENYYRENSNKWYKDNYKEAPFISYVLGWNLVSPVFLEIKLNKNNNVVDFWIKEY